MGYSNFYLLFITLGSILLDKKVTICETLTLRYRTNLLFGRYGKLYFSMRDLSLPRNEPENNLFVISAALRLENASGDPSTSHLKIQILFHS